MLGITRRVTAFSEQAAGGSKQVGPLPTANCRLLCKGFPDKSPCFMDFPDKRRSLFPHVKANF
jgi:hypothetical protein